MDYDAAEMVIKEVLSHRLSDRDEALFSGLSAALKKFDWDAMEKIMKEQKLEKR